MSTCIEHKETICPLVAFRMNLSTVVNSEAVHCCVCTHCTERLSTVVYVQWGCPLLCMYSEVVLCCVCTVRLSTVVYSEAVHCCVQYSEAVRCCAQWGCPLLCTVRLSTVVYSFETVFTVQRPGSVEEWPESYFLITVSPTNTMRRGWFKMVIWSPLMDWTGMAGVPSC